MSIEKARKKLELAKSQLERVQTASWDPSDAVIAVTFAFYAYENAVEAVAEAKGERFSKKHWEKARIAGKLKESGYLTTDVKDWLSHLNDLRKSVSYGEPGPELQELNLEELASDLEDFLEEVEEVVNSDAE